jgi:2,3-bisphosphoglycerate-independent phosphoglycerate mutase
LNDLVEAVLNRDGTVVVTADHGNAEELVTFPASSFYFTTNKGTVNTDHSNNPVPVIIINNKLKGNPINLGRGILADVAPTVLNLMGLKVPEVMTGRNLLKVSGG